MSDDSKKPPPLTHRPMRFTINGTETSQQDTTAAREYYARLEMVKRELAKAPVAPKAASRPIIQFNRNASLKYNAKGKSNDKSDDLER
jgi:hypothetical protein